MAQIDAFFKMIHELGASDLHLSSGSQPVVRLHGELQRVKYKVLEHEELKKMLFCTSKKINNQFYFEIKRSMLELQQLKSSIKEVI